MTFGPQEKQDAREALKEAQGKARPVSKRVAEKLARLDLLVTRRAKARKFVEDSTEYDILKDLFLDRLANVPALTYTDAAGKRRFATAFRSTKLSVDVELLRKILIELKFDEAIIDKILPRKVDPEQLRRWIAKNEELRKRFTEFAEEVPHISYVTFSDLVTEDEEEVDDRT